jgi:plasmid stability protein
MCRTITIRNIPDEVADELSARARASGRSLQSFLAQLLSREASLPDTARALRQVRDEARREGAAVDNRELLSILNEERDA